MGIKGIYGEIGPGERMALSKLAVEKYEQTGRPLRVAVDISIWLFQIQAGQGGSNPAIRTFYYRLLRLLSLSVQTLFVFDGPHKPPFKRNKRTGHQGATLPHLLAKQLLKLFGFPFHIAPGEAEAECALLQREGIVDAVLSEDVDTLMFGCGLTFRNWSSEGVRGNKSPTHVSVYDAQATKKGKSGLDREGMVLVALMSGGDYITEGILGCGIKVACEAARAGYGKALCQLSKADIAGIDAWRKGLAHEVQTNESKYFRIKHKTLKIPNDFPNSEVLNYYTHPVVSSDSKIQKLKEDILWDGEVDVRGLRLFVAEAFEWTHKVGARKFIRGLAPAMLVHKLRVRGDRRDSGYGDVILTAMNEMELVRAICGKRSHFSTDGIPELRVIYHPAEIVGLDLDSEEDDSEDYGRDGLAPLNEDHEIDAYTSDAPSSTARIGSPSKRSPSVYDPTQPDKAWIPETIAKVGIPLKVEDYEESLRNPRKFMKAKHAAKKAASKGGMAPGAMDKFVKVSKSRAGDGRTSKSKSPAYSSSQPAPALKDPLPSFRKTGSSQPVLGLSSTMATRHPRLTRSTVSWNKETTIHKSTRENLSTRTEDCSQKPPLRTTSETPKNITNLRGTPPITTYLNRQTKPSMPPQMKISTVHTYDLSSSPSSPPPLTTLLPTRSSPTRTKHVRSASPRGGPEAEEANFPRSPAVLNHEMNRNHLPTNSLSTNNQQDSPSPRKKPYPLPRSNYSPSEIIRSLDSHFTPLTPEPVNRIIDFQSQSATRDHSEAPELPTMAAPFSPRHNLPSISRAGSPNCNLPLEVITLSSSPPQPAPICPTLPSRTQNDKSSPTRLDSQSAQQNEGVKIQKTVEKKLITLRESLPGAWREVDESNMDTRWGGRRRMWRESQVEILDLSQE